VNKSKTILLFILICISANCSFSKEQCVDLFGSLPLFLQSNQLLTKHLTINEFEIVDHPLEHGLIEINRFRSNLRKHSQLEEFNFDPNEHIWDTGGANYFFKHKKSLEELKTNYPQLAKILYHPGVFYRIEEFVAFIRNHPDVTLAEALDLFTKHLGNKVYYRSLYLDEATAQSFKKREKNILANNMYVDRKEKLKYPDFWHEYKRANKSKPIGFSDYAVGLTESIENHVVNRTSKFVLSVTEYPEVALAVGQMLKSENPTPDKKVYLAKISVPVIDTIPNFKKDDHAFSLTIKLDNKTVLKKLDVADDQVESFMLFGIDRHDILEFDENETAYKLEMVRKSKRR